MKQKSLFYKTLLNILTILLIIFIFSSCKKFKNLNVDTTYKEIPKTSGSFKINITSNTEWSVSSNSDWCIVKTTKGNNDCSMSVSYDANNELAKRTAIIALSGDDVDNKDITVIQDEGVCYISKEVSHNAIGETVWEYEYNEKNQLIFKKQPNVNGGYFYIYKYEYNSNNKLVKVGDDFQHTVYNYDINGQLDETISFFNNEITGRKKYHYIDGNLMKVDLYNTDNDKYKNEEYIYDEIGNVTNHIYNTLTDGVEIKEKEEIFTYGNKRNPYLNLNIPKTGIMLGINNYTHIRTILYYEGNTYTTSYEIVYLLNENDYPTVRTNNYEIYTFFEYK